MRSSHLVLFATIAILPGITHAKAWQGISPGVSTQADVLSRFGAPSTQGKLEGHSAIVYKGDQAITGTRQAQFLASQDGTITEINVFPATQLDRETVEGTYGKSAQKTFTEDFRTVWIYRALGVMVFFGKNGFVEAIRFKVPETAASSRSPATVRPPSAARQSGAPATATESQPHEKEP